MRIVLVHPHDVWSPQEPWTIRILQLASALRQFGHETRVVYFPRTDDPRDRPSRWRDVPVIPFNRRAGPWTLLGNTIRLWRLAGSVDALHVQKAFHWAAVPTLIAGWLRRVPVHYDWDDWEAAIYVASAQPPSSLVVWWLKLLERCVPRLAQTVSVASERLQQEALACGVRPDRIWWAPVGADPEVFRPEISSARVREQFQLNGATVLYLGQLHGGQYVELLLQAAVLVERQVPSARILIVGDGYRRAALEQMARDLGLSCVTFVGTVPHERVPEHIAAADVCVAAFEANPVTQCKSPLKLAEYLSCGKAIVASDVGEIPRMLGDAGIRVPAGSAEPLAAALIHLLKDPAERRRLGQLARQRAITQFTWQRTARRLEEAYRMALGPHSSSE